MKIQQKSRWKEILDNILVYNLYILILGSIFFVASIILSLNGNTIGYDIFQRLWYPLFIPVLSLFFTAVLIDAITAIFNEEKQN